jgi:hypothetical protein
LTQETDISPMHPPRDDFLFTGHRPSKRPSYLAPFPVFYDRDVLAISPRVA